MRAETILEAISRLNRSLSWHNTKGNTDLFAAKLVSWGRLFEAGSMWLPAAGSYRKSLLKAFQKTMDEKRFSVVIVDAPNLLVDDFKPYWSAGQVTTVHQPSTFNSLKPVLQIVMHLWQLSFGSLHRCSLAPLLSSACQFASSAGPCYNYGTSASLSD